MSAETTRRENELVEEHLPLVYSLAKKVIHRVPRGSIEIEDLIAFGQEGLVQAARRYDPERGVAFSTFAYYRIRGAMFDGLRKMGPVVYLGQKLRFEERADEVLEGQAAGAPRDAEDAARRLGGALSDLTVAYILCSDEVGERPDKTVPDPSQVTQAREELALVRRKLRSLPEKERRLVQLMYFEGLSMLEAGKKLGMSKGWASRLHARALTRLREETADAEERPPPTAIRV